MSDRLSKMPLSAPIWVWIAYAAIVLILGVLANLGLGFTACIMTAAFSFQFWTFAAWRGQRRAEAEANR